MSVIEFANDEQQRLNQGRHAVVIGGSLGGMLTARVLSDYFERVTVIERDLLPTEPSTRKSVPQGNHVHALMKRGQIILEQLFPGLKDELVAAGAHVLDLASEAAWLTPAGWGVHFPSELKMLAMTRPLIDWHVRRRLNRHPQVTFIDNTEIVRLLPNEKNDGVAGVVTRSRHQEDEPETDLWADLIVDAGGRGSRAPKWLEQLGYRRPAETTINAFLGYASRSYKMPANARANWKCAYIQAAPPHRTRGAVLFPVEGDRWLLSMIGGGRDYPPSDEQGFLEFARSLAAPIVYETVKDLEPCSPVFSHRSAENRLRHFERMSRFPENFLVIGDAACAFNPVYGQGMTIAAMGALALSESLAQQRKRQPDGSLKGFSRRFQRKLAKVNAAPWLLATGEDFRYQGTEGGCPTRFTRFMHAYMDQVVQLTLTDKEVRRVLLEIFHMLRKPTALFQPAIVLKVLKLLLTPAPIFTRETIGNVRISTQGMLHKSEVSTDNI